MTLSVVYRKSGEGSIASFNFVDIATGTGFVDFYAGTSANRNLLRSNLWWSDTITTSGAATSATFTKNIDKDFDVTFLKPTIIDGETVLNVPWAISSNISAKEFTSFVQATVKKFDGTTETDLITASGAVLAFVSPGVVQREYIDAFTIDIPRTNFRAGDTLRLTMEVWGKSEGGVLAIWYLGHDPKARAGNNDKDAFNWGTTPTTLLFQVPFKIDL